MNELTKRKIKHYIEYNWIIIILIFIITYVFFFYTISNIDAYISYEQLNFFIVARALKDEDLKNDLMNQDKRILKYNWYLYPPELDNLYVLYQAFGENADILLFSKSDLEDLSSTIKGTFLQIEGEFKNSLMEGVKELETFQYENKDYGLKIFDCNNEDYNNKYNFSAFLDFANNDDYYLVFAKNSKKFCECGNNSNDMALVAANTILRRYAYES